MERDVFVDTSGFYALLARGDDQHEKASGLLRDAARRKRRFVSTDYVLDETATLLKARGLGHLVPSFFEVVAQSRACVIEWTDVTRFESTQRYFLKHLDHAWSFTDCLSFQVMKQRRIREALTKVEHFREAGFLPLLVA